MCIYCNRITHNIIIIIDTDNETRVRTLIKYDHIIIIIIYHSTHVTTKFQKILYFALNYHKLNVFGIQ